MSSTLPTSMRAWQFSQSSGGLDKNLILNSFAPLPSKSSSLGANDILIQVLSSAINPVDYKLADNPLFRMLAYGAPATPGIDFAGRVVAAGSSPSSLEVDLKPGQLIFGRLDRPMKFGTLAEYTIAPRSGCAAIPEGVSLHDAASIGTAGLTAYQSLAPYVKAGDRVFINGGSGGTGIFGIQIAKALGCHVVTSCSNANAELCESLGADKIIDYRSQDVVKTLKGMGEGFDLVVDNVGGPPETYWNAHSFMKEKGRIVQVGATPGLATAYEVLSRMLWPGFLGGSRRGYSVLMLKNDVEGFKRIAEWMKEGKVKAVIDEVFEMEEKGAVRAFQKLKTGRAKGKIIIRIAS